MKLSGLNESLALIANLGVIAGIVFLAIEIQQNTEMMRAQLLQSRSESTLVLAQPEFSSDYLPRIRVKLESGEQLTPVESRSYISWLRSFLREQDTLYQLHQLGLYDDYVLRSIETQYQSFSSL